MNCLYVDVALAILRLEDVMFPDGGEAESGLPAVSVKVDLWILVVEAMSGGGEVLGGDDARPAVVKLPVGTLVRWS